jgi:hypothetical protein
MRCLFWNERLLEKYHTHELDIELGPLRERRNPTSDARAIYNQDWLFLNPATRSQVARCHTFVADDTLTIAGSGYPDPKHMTLRGADYHLVGHSGKPCAHCEAEMTTYPTGDAYPENVP